MEKKIQLSLVEYNIFPYREITKGYAVQNQTKPKIILVASMVGEPMSVAWLVVKIMN